MAISHKGFHADVMTFKAETTIKDNLTVSILSGDVCKMASAGERFIGVCVHNRNGLVSVQTEGYVEVSYTGVTPTLGYCNLVSAGTSGVKVMDNGIPYRVIKLDTENKTVGFIL